MKINYSFLLAALVLAGCSPKNMYQPPADTTTSAVIQNETVIISPEKTVELSAETDTLKIEQSNDDTLLDFQDYDPKSVMVQAIKTLTEAEANTISKDIKYKDDLGENLYLFEVVTTKDPEEIQNEIQDHPLVDYAQPDYYPFLIGGGRQGSGGGGNGGGSGSGNKNQDFLNDYLKQTCNVDAYQTGSSPEETLAAAEERINQILEASTRAFLCEKSKEFNQSCMTQGQGKEACDKYFPEPTENTECDEINKLHEEAEKNGLETRYTDSETSASEPYSMARTFELVSGHICAVQAMEILAKHEENSSNLSASLIGGTEFQKRSAKRDQAAQQYAQFNTNLDTAVNRSLSEKVHNQAAFEKRGQAIIRNFQLSRRDKHLDLITEAFETFKCKAVNATVAVISNPSTEGYPDIETCLVPTQP